MKQQVGGLEKVASVNLLTLSLEIPWLIVYANAKTLDSLEEYWPDETSKGRAIITASRDIVDSKPRGKLHRIQREHVINVSHFPEPSNIQEVIEDHLRIPYHLPPGSNIIFSDAEKAKLPSIFAVASSQYQHLMMTGALIGRQIYDVNAIASSFEHWQIDQDGPVPVWQLAFDSLSNNCNDILSILSCLKDEVRIPRDIFKSVYLPLDMRWCQNDDE